MTTDTTTIPFGDENYLPAARRFVFQSPLGGKFHAMPNIFGHATDSLCTARSSGWMTLDVGFGDLADESNRCKRCVRLAQDEADQFALYEADQITATDEDGFAVGSNPTEDDDEPQEEDITVNPTGYLGSQYAVGVVNGEYIGTFNTGDEVDAVIKAYMAKHQYFPSVWNISDHGNSSIRGIDYED